MELKVNTVSDSDIFYHFIDCKTQMHGIDLHNHSKKIRSFATTFEAWNNSELVGLCACYMNNPNTGIAYITHIEVHPECKHQGFGKKLMLSTIDTAKSKGFNMIQLEVDKGNTTAISFYNTFGFNVVEDRQSKYLMSLNL